MTFAVIQTIETAAFAGSPLPVRVNGVPATASLGFAVRMVMLAAGVAAGASGPGSAATPESAGMTRGGSGSRERWQEQGSLQRRNAATSFRMDVHRCRPFAFVTGMTLIV